MPQSVSPASIRPAPMAKTAILPASAMVSPIGPHSAIQGANWSPLPGSATEVAAAPDGSLWALSTGPSGPDKYIWQFVNGTWSNISGLAQHIAVAPDGSLYAINSGGGVYEYPAAQQSAHSGIWTALGGGASAIAAASDGSIYVISNGGSSPDKAIWHNAGGTWSQVAGAGVALAASWDKAYYAGPHPGGSGAIQPGGVYILNAEGSIYYENPDGSFATLPANASALAATTIGGVFALGYPSDANGNGIYYYDLNAGGWTAEPGAASAISCGNGNLYAVSSSGAIFVTAVTAYVASTPTPSAPPSPAPGATMPPDGSTLIAYLATAPPTQYVDYAASGYGYGIATTADGTIYVTQEQSGNPGQYVKISGGGNATAIQLPPHFSSPGLAVRGADGGIWFSDQSVQPGAFLNGQYLTRVDPGGALTEYNVPWSESDAPFGIALGPDGNVWFTEYYEGRIGRVTPQGSFADYSIGTRTDRPSGLAVGPDGNIWVADGMLIDKVSPAGTMLASYPVAISSFHIVAAPDGDMWFVDTSNGIGRIDMSGNSQTWILPCDVPGVGDFCVPGHFAGDTDIVIGPDGNIWFPVQNYQAVARMTLAGYLTEWYVPPNGNGSASPFSATTFGNSVLFVGGGNRLVRVTP
jgi:hypothetical protein